jgi:hypothetical protein
MKFLALVMQALRPRPQHTGCACHSRLAYRPRGHEGKDEAGARADAPRREENVSPSSARRRSDTR